MAGRQHQRNHGADLLSFACAARLPSIVEAIDGIVDAARTNLAIASRSLADKLVGPVERWCAICELELELHASDTTCLAQNGDDDA